MMSRVRARLRGTTGDAPVLPLAVLFILNTVDELDQVTYAIIAPEIRDTFGVAESTVVAIGALSAALVIMLAVPVGYLADRTNRTRLVAIAAILWGSMMVLTGISGFVGAIGLLVLARFGAGLGRVMNEPVHVGLLADFYPPSQHGRVYSLHRSANAIGAMCVLACGALADLVGWRAAFILLSIPTFLAVLLAAQLREPPRGASLDQSLALRADAHAAKVPFRTALRRLRAVPTLRRTWVAGFFIGASVLPIAIFMNFFFEHVHGVTSITARGAIIMLFGAGSLVGLNLGGRLATKALMSANLPHLPVLAGRTLMGMAVALLALAQAPWLALSVACVFLVGIGASVYSYNLPLLTAVSPPRLRSQGLGYFVFFVGIGAMVVSPAVAGLGERVGYRTAITSLAAILVVGGAVYRTAGRTAAEDADAAFRTLVADAGAGED